MKTPATGAVCSSSVYHMKTFTCQCGATLYFENTRCLACDRKLGFLPDELKISALEPSGSAWNALANDKTYRMCNNYAAEDVCNWMVPIDDANEYCLACRLNQTIPNLNEPKNRILWFRMEAAKRWLFYMLLRLNLPITDRQQDPQRGLAFQFLADTASDQSISSEEYREVVTGHHSGCITINLSEADHSSREEMREKMSEHYRTLLGHFRHEIGHYYWMLLIDNRHWLDQYRDIFGDERTSYDESLQRYYQQGPVADWESSFISAYASAHPWEDWAETWAHYLHMLDTLETAHDHGFALHGQSVAPPPIARDDSRQLGHFFSASLASFDNLIRDWSNLTLAMNALNRSMGLPDAYPFVLTGAVTEKLRFVHRVIQDVAS